MQFSFKNIGKLPRMGGVSGFVAGLVAVCAMFGVSADYYRSEAKRYELDGFYESLILCADALDEWENAKYDAERLAAAIRFENSVSGLPAEVGIEPLLALADNMRTGDSAATRVRVLHDTFALLSSIEYSNSAHARDIIASTLDGVNGELVQPPPPIFARTSDASPAISPEILIYSRKNTMKSMRALLGISAGTFEAVLSEDGDAWIAQNDNLKMSFSAADGSLDGFVYIRLGDTPPETCDEGERLSRTLAFFRKMRRVSGDVSVRALGELGGFLLAEISDSGEIWQSCVDSYGRVWSLMKVKR